MEKNDGYPRSLKGTSDNSKSFKFVVYTLFMFLLIISCFILTDKVKNNSGIPQFKIGRYSGIIPLSGKLKLDVSILFDPDYTFTLQEQLIDPTAKKKPDLFTYSGSWSFDSISKEINLKYSNKDKSITSFSILQKHTIQMHRSDVQGQKTSGHDYNLIYKKWYQF